MAWWAATTSWDEIDHQRELTGDRDLKPARLSCYVKPIAPWHRRRWSHYIDDWMQDEGDRSRGRHGVKTSYDMAAAAAARIVRCGFMQKQIWRHKYRPRAALQFEAVSRMLLKQESISLFTITIVHIIGCWFGSLRFRHAYNIWFQKTSLIEKAPVMLVPLMLSVLIGFIGNDLICCITFFHNQSLTHTFIHQMASQENSVSNEEQELTRFISTFLTSAYLS